MSILKEYILKESAAKKLSGDEWLLKTAKACAKGCKFVINSHPELGYISTSSVKCNNDIYCGANNIPAAKLLNLVLEDGQTFYSHLVNRTESVRDCIDTFGDYDTIRGLFLEIDANYKPSAISPGLPQVYFPTGEGNYHLLTVLPPSSVMQETKKRIKNMFDTKDENTDETEVIPPLLLRRGNMVKTKYGGSKPQNISFDNNLNGGYYYMICSVPPKVRDKYITIPYRSFFHNTLRYRQYTSLFFELHKCFRNWQHNKEARKAVINAEVAIVDSVYQKVSLLRMEHEGWSDRGRLPYHQAVWLDDKYIDARHESTEWLDNLVADFALWIVNSYKKVLNDKAVPLGGAEFNDLEKQIKSYIKSVNF